MKPVSQPATPPRPLTPANREPSPSPQGALRLTPSGRDLMALNIAIPAENSAPMDVRVMGPHRKNRARCYEDLKVEATKIDDWTLEDSNHVIWHLGKIFQGGVHGAVRLITKPDPIRAQIYVAKELRHADTRPGEPKTASPGAATMPQGAAARALDDKARQLMVLDDDFVPFEVNNMLRCDSPLAPHGVLVTRDRDYLLLPVLDGTLEQMVNTGRGPEHRPGAGLPEPLTRTLPHFFMVQGSEALAGVHQAGMAHRDVKGNNFFFEAKSKRLFLGDFGIAVPVELRAPILGPQAYLPPEAFFPEGKRPSPYDRVKADIWSLGAYTVQIMIDDNLLQPLMAKREYLPLCWQGKKTYRELFWPLFEAYTTAWADAWHSATAPAAKKSRRLGRPALAPRPTFIRSRSAQALGEAARPHYDAVLAKFRRLQLMDPKLFGPLLLTLNPDPRLRPNAQDVPALIARHKGAVVPDLSELMNATKMALAKDRQEDEPGAWLSMLISRSHSSLSSVSSHLRSHSVDPNAARASGL